jgi:hypothetical protein
VAVAVELFNLVEKSNLSQQEEKALSDILVNEKMANKCFMKSELLR